MKLFERFRKFKNVRTKKGLKRVLVAEKKSDSHCAICHSKLNLSTDRKNVSQVRKMPGSKRRPERPYGGTLCPSCTRTLTKYRARLEDKSISKDQVEVRFAKYL